MQLKHDPGSPGLYIWDCGGAWLLLVVPGVGNLLAGCTGWLCCLLQLSLLLVLDIFFRLAALLLAAFLAFSSLLTSSSSAANWSCSYTLTVVQPYSERSVTLIRFCLAAIMSKPCFSSSLALSIASCWGPSGRFTNSSCLAVATNWSFTLLLKIYLLFFVFLLSEDEHLVLFQLFNNALCSIFFACRHIHF